MPTPTPSLLLRIFVGGNHKAGRLPLHEAIVVRAREMQMAGATVLRGVLGFGHSSRLHRAHALKLSLDLPVVVEIVDTEERINAFLPVLDELMSSGGLVTLENARVLTYTASRPPSDSKVEEMTGPES